MISMNKSSLMKSGLTLCVALFLLSSCDGSNTNIVSNVQLADFRDEYGCPNRLGTSNPGMLQGYWEVEGGTYGDFYAFIADDGDATFLWPYSTAESSEENCLEASGPEHQSLTFVGGNRYVSVFDTLQADDEASCGKYEVAGYFLANFSSAVEATVYIEQNDGSVSSRPQYWKKVEGIASRNDIQECSFSR